MEGPGLVNLLQIIENLSPESDLGSSPAWPIYSSYNELLQYAKTQFLRLWGGGENPPHLPKTP